MPRFDGSGARHTLWLLGMLAGFAVPPAVAQDRERADAGADVRRYTVELIVFTYGAGESAGSEIFVPESVPGPDLRGEGRTAVFGDLASDRSAAPAGGESLPGKPAAEETAAEPEISGFDRDLEDIPLRARIELHTLPPEQYSMDEIHARLVELDAYHPIMRTAWTQTTPSRDASPAIRLRALGDPPPGLDGTVQLYQGRFVHLGIDIALDAQAPVLEDGEYDARQSATDRAIARAGIADDGRDGEAPAWNDERFGAADGFPSRPVRYRISEVRIMKDGVIRYYDHPRFGVIAKLTEVKPEKPEGPDDRDAFTGGD